MGYSNRHILMKIFDPTDMKRADTIVIILAIIIFAEVVWILWSRHEGFTNPPKGLDTAYPASDKTEMTPDAQDDDPRDIPWYASWTAADKRARRGHNCNATNTQEGPDGTTLITTTKSCEDGLPHTRIGNRIYIPDNISTVARQDVIRHELIHVYQRRNPNAWLKFYQRNWSFMVFKQPPADMQKELIDAKRSNPDTWDPAMGGSWACWKGRWWPLAIYKDAMNPRLRDVTIVYWDAWKKEAFEEPPKDWVDFFGSPDQPEHPHEIAANLIVAGETETEAGRRLMTWWESTGKYQIHSSSEKSKLSLPPVPTRSELK